MSITELTATIRWRDNVGPDLMGVSGDGDVKSGPCLERPRLYPMAASIELIFGIAFEA